MNFFVVVYLVLALAMPAMSASNQHRPVTAEVGSPLTKRTIGSFCAKVTSTASGRTNSNAGTSGKKAAVNGAARRPKKGRASRRDSSSSMFDVELSRRFSNTNLCGLDILRTTLCLGNPGYLVDIRTGRSSWSNWDSIKGKVTARNAHSSYGCDQSLDHLVIVHSLTNAGFCKALSKMGQAWKKLGEKSTRVIMKQLLSRPGSIKELANQLSGVHYVDIEFLQTKFAWVDDYLRGTPEPTTSELKGYYSNTVVADINFLAPRIDAAAHKFLDNIRVLATGKLDPNTATPTQLKAACAIEKAQSEIFKPDLKPVSDQWNKMKSVILA